MKLQREFLDTNFEIGETFNCWCFDWMLLSSSGWRWWNPLRESTCECHEIPCQGWVFNALYYALGSW